MKRKCKAAVRALFLISFVVCVGCSRGNAPTPTATKTPPTTLSTPIPTQTIKATPSEIIPNIPITANIPDQDFAGDSEKIAFISHEGLGSTELYIVNKDGSNPTRLTTSPNDIGGITWSPDGSKITFSYGNLTERDVYVLEISTGKITRLTEHLDDDYLAKWSPDGSKIAFLSNRSGLSQIYIINIDGSGLTLLTDEKSGYRYANHNWSPDGTKIVFEAYISIFGGDHYLYVMDSDGKNVNLLSGTQGTFFVPEWSPDGSQIAFKSDRDGEEEIYVMDRKGYNVIRLTNTSEIKSILKWSPDGTKIAFVEGEIIRQDILVMNADGSDPICLTDDLRNDWDFDWSPDGQKIVFTSVINTMVTGRVEDIFIIDIDGSNLTKLMDIPSNRMEPEWYP